MPKEPEDPKDEKLEKRESEERTVKAPDSLVDGKDEQAAGQALAEEEGWNASKFLYRELLSREESPNRRDYFGLINRLPKSEAPPENYAQHWSTLLQDKDRKESQKKIALLKKVLAGKILIDLGGGKGEHLRGDGVYERATYAPSTMQEVAQQLHVKAYVNVDRYHTSRDIIDPHNVTEQLGIAQPRGTHVIYAEGDMLEFLSQMPDQKSDVVLVLNGIDAFVINSRSYREALAQEIARVVPPGGAVMTCGSEDITKHLEKLGFEVAEDFPKQGWPAFPQLWIKK